MKAFAFAVPFLAMALTLSGCGSLSTSAERADADDGAGRYSGLGTYPADPLWKHVERATAGNDAALASLDDDSQIIVVVDRQTGEVRQCGNNSGQCIAMNPWTGTSPARAPVRLGKHAAQLEQDESAGFNAAGPPAQ